MATTDHYQVLGVAYDDPPEKIRSRYRLLVFNVHPDIADVGRTDEFIRYTQAYRVLSRSDRRQVYNQEIGIFVKPRPLHPGIDLYQRLTVTPEQAEQGIVTPLTFTRYEPCPLCWLAGCHRCQQQGMLLEQVTVTVKITAHSHHKAVILIENEGGRAEPGGSRGNLFVYVMIRQPA